jgi:hypothetical protein
VFFAVFLCWNMPLFERTLRLNKGMCHGRDVVDVFIGCVGVLGTCPDPVSLFFVVFCPK